MVVGFLDLRGCSVADIEALPEPFDYICWDVYSEVGRWYEPDPDGSSSGAALSTPWKRATAEERRPAAWSRDGSSIATWPRCAASTSTTTS